MRCSSCTDGMVSTCGSCLSAYTYTIPTSCICPSVAGISQYFDIIYGTCKSEYYSCVEIDINSIGCSVTCASCSGSSSTQCLTCTTSLYMYQYQCMTVCPQGFWGNTTAPAQCMPCDPSCLTCNGATSTNCLSCSVNNALSSGTCLGGCPTVNQYQNSSYSFSNIKSISIY